MSCISHPPPQPERFLGPYLAYKTTEIETRTHIVTALILSPAHFPEPKLEIFNETTRQNTQVLYEYLYGYRVLRVQLETPMPSGKGVLPISYQCTFQIPSLVVAQQNSGVYHVPHWDEPPKAGFFSCNGFDSSVTEERAQHFGFDDVWKHFNSVHDGTPMHLVVGGGDQVYMVSGATLVSSQYP